MKRRFHLLPLPWRLFSSCTWCLSAKANTKGHWGASLKRVMCSDFLSFSFPLNFWSWSVELKCLSLRKGQNMNMNPDPPTLLIPQHPPAPGIQLEQEDVLFSEFVGFHRRLESWQVCHLNRPERGWVEWECVIHKEINALQKWLPTYSRHRTASFSSWRNRYIHILCSLQIYTALQVFLWYSHRLWCGVKLLPKILRSVLRNHSNAFINWETHCRRFHLFIDSRTQHGVQ